MSLSPLIRFGTSTWTYEGWQGQVYKRQSMPASTLLFGDWSTVMIAEWGALELQADPFMKFKQGIVGLRAMWTVDVGFRHYKSFSLAISVT